MDGIGSATQSPHTAPGGARPPTPPAPSGVRPPAGAQAGWDVAWPPCARGGRAERSLGLRRPQSRCLHRRLTWTDLACARPAPDWLWRTWGGAGAGAGRTALPSRVASAPPPSLSAVGAGPWRLPPLLLRCLGRPRVPGMHGSVSVTTPNACCRERTSCPLAWASADGGPAGLPAAASSWSWSGHEQGVGILLAVHLCFH